MILEEEYKVKIGIIGTGDISKEMIKSAKTLNLEIVSVLSRRREKAQSFADEFHLKEAYDSLDDFFNSQIDIVYIGIPNSLHYEYAKKCLEKGKHVLLEKPLVLKYEQYEELLALASLNEVMILEVDRVNFLPNFQIIKENIDDSISLIQIDFCKQSRRYNDYCEGKLPHIFDRKYGGGALYDLGVYGLHFIVGLIGEPNDLTYRCQLGKGGVDMFGVLLLYYPNCIVNITLSKISNGHSCIQIQGEHVQISSDSAPSRLIDLKVKKYGEIKEYHDSINNFTHYLKRVIQMIESKDMDAYSYQTQKSKSVLKLLEIAQNKGGFSF